MARDLTRSPFPGMDPYLEQYWGDVHARFCTYSCDLLRKSSQEELLYGVVNLVEVDLIRSGNRNLRAPLGMLERDQRAPYYVSVTRGRQSSRSEVYPVKLQNRLPVIGIPLRETDPDATLDLQAVFNQLYENGSYGYDVDYTKSPVPPLNDVDSAWAKDWLAQNCEVA